MAYHVFFLMGKALDDDDDDAEVVKIETCFLEYYLNYVAQSKSYAAFLHTLFYSIFVSINA